MNIMIAGGGKVGKTLARQLAAEGHDLTIIDQSENVLSLMQERFDAITVHGNCASMEVLKQAGIENADLLIAATNADELNLLCCMTAHGLNTKIHTIARIRNPEYGEQIMTMRNVFPLSMTINPERQAALEIERLIKYPGFLRRDSFAKGRAEIVELRIDKDSKLCNISLSEMNRTVKCKVLVCAVLRAGTAIAPRGDFVLQDGDKIFVTASTATLTVLLKNLGILTRKARKVLLCGGGRVSYYLAKLLEQDGISAQLIDKDYDRCLELAALLPDTAIIHGDCSNRALLEQQGIDGCDALVSLTGRDEVNMIVSLYAARREVPQIITKLSYDENFALADSLALGSTISPKALSCNQIVRYVRAMQNQAGAALSVHTIADGQMEAVEFMVDTDTKNCNTPLRQMKLKPNVLIAGIIHGANTLIPDGDSVFVPGDTLIVVSGGQVLRQLSDIFA